MPCTAQTGKNIFIIYENTCADWMTAAQGCFSQSMVVSTCYATLGVDAVKDAVIEGSVFAMMCNRKSVPNIAKMIKEMPTLKVRGPRVGRRAHCERRWYWSLS